MTPDVSPSPMADWIERAWLTRYLDRELTAAETDWFENYILDKPHLLDAVESDTRLRDALWADSENLRRKMFVGQRHGVSIGRSKRVQAIWATAASLFLGVGIGWVGQSAVKDRPTQVIAGPERIRIDGERGYTTLTSEDENEGGAKDANREAAFLLFDVAVPPGATGIKLFLDDSATDLNRDPHDGFATFVVRRSEFDKAVSAKIQFVDGEGKPKLIEVKTKD